MLFNSAFPSIATEVNSFPLNLSIPVLKNNIHPGRMRMLLWGFCGQAYVSNALL